MSTTHRTLRVLRTERITPRMARVTLGGDELAGFPEFGPDQRVKLFFPGPGQERPAMPRASSGGPVWPPGQPRPVIRTYTIRRFDAEAGELDVDFVLHGGEHGEGGPAAAWAAQARQGDWVGVSEPGGRYQPDPDARAHLVIGDESALPAVATVLDTLLRFTGPIAVYLEVANAEEEQPLPLPPAAQLHWLHRGDQREGQPLVTAVRAAKLPGDAPGEHCQAWLSAEAAAVRELRAHLLDDRAIPRRRLYATAYWRAH